MARLVMDDDVVSGEPFLHVQLFVFGGFMLPSNLTDRLEQVQSYAPGNQIRYGNLSYVANI